MNMNDEARADLERSGWENGMRDAAQLLAIYPEGYTPQERHLLDQKRREILAVAGIKEPRHHNPRRIGDGVTAAMLNDELHLAVENGDGSEAVIVMSKETCQGLMHYIRQNVLCNEGQ